MLRPDLEGIVILDSQKDKPIGRMNASIQNLYDLIDKMGAGSAKVIILLLRLRIGTKIDGDYYNWE